MFMYALIVNKTTLNNKKVKCNENEMKMKER